MKVLIIITGLGVGGAEKVVSSLCDDLVKSGYQVKLLYLYGDVIIKPSSNSVEIKKIPINFMMLSELRTEFDKFKPDIVHSHMFHANMLSRLLKLINPRVKLINTSHSSKEGTWIRDLSYRATNKLTDCFTNVSMDSVHAFEKRKAVKKGNMICIYNGIDVELFIKDNSNVEFIKNKYKIKNEVITFLSIGSLRPAKDYDMLLKVANKLNAKGINFKWLVIGTGPELERLEKDVETHFLSDRVEFLGFRSNVVPYINASDYFVMTSKWEGFGLVVAEAMACETTVIATDCGPIREVMGSTGYISPVGDDSLMCSNIINAIDLSETDKLKQGKLARKRVVSLFSSSISNSNWIRLYKEVIS